MDLAKYDTKEADDLHDMVFSADVQRGMGTRYSTMGPAMAAVCGRVLLHIYDELVTIRKTLARLREEKRDDE